MSPVSRKRKSRKGSAAPSQVRAVPPAYRADIGRLVADVVTEGRSISDPVDRKVTLAILKSYGVRGYPPMESWELEEVLAWYQRLYAAGDIQVVNGSAWSVRPSDGKLVGFGSMILGG